MLWQSKLSWHFRYYSPKWRTCAQILYPFRIQLPSSVPRRQIMAIYLGICQLCRRPTRVTAPDLGLTWLQLPGHMRSEPVDRRFLFLFPSSKWTNAFLKRKEMHISSSRTTKHWGKCLAQQLRHPGGKEWAQYLALAPSFADADLGMAWVIGFQPPPWGFGLHSWLLVSALFQAFGEWTKWWELRFFPAEKTNY